MRAAITIAAAFAVALVPAGCGDAFRDRILPTNDPCEFVLDFGTRCTPGGKTSICIRRGPVIARNISPECGRPSSP